ncbi:Glutamyl-Q tRNA(Asp) synthetase [Propionispora sp. 2/2-37]|uniref:tRNA glutamyl-Q(34) synthetase GluQRS n=1 Tax=Propionispora sp. 2/2-37 TaxID=1677858 RepID=UPI0006C48C3A|nr:tRNA glutamyl-Q(34) synthetase GluQRS [Propionispora sp. 2/2-37]CUH96727.1 Glutamyl-Q tRNA(Asp) synthetase [Propionispora sp. 2/2-37]
MGNTLRGRFAPSPTGHMHLGNAWTALLAWLQVRSAGGTMVLRMEDLDPDRSRPAYAAALQVDLRWLGLDWDEGPDAGGDYGPYCQSVRSEFYQEAFERLAAAGRTYPCYCTRAELAAAAPHASDGEQRYPGTCRNRKVSRTDRKPAMRLLVPPGSISYSDLLYGEIQQNIEQSVGDFVLRRSDGVYAYQLAVVVDDAAMHITHVLRGNDLIASTPRQLLLYRLLSLKQPVFTHVPLLLGQDGSRLSKRHGDLSLTILRRRGIRPEQIVGYLACQAGLIPEYSAVEAKELIACFDISRLAKKPVVIPGNITEILA